MIGHIQQQKKIFRSHYRNILGSIPIAARHIAADKACKDLKKLVDSRGHSGPSVQSRNLTLSFMPMGSELDITPLNRALFANGDLVLPRVTSGATKDLRKLELYHMQGLTADYLERSNYGILEPRPDKNTYLDPSDPRLGVILVPGLAFTALGSRLGQGAGYYDRLLGGIRLGLNGEPRADAPIMVGIGFEQQKSEILPMEKHDICLDEIRFY